MRQRTRNRTGLLVAVLVILGFVAGAGLGLDYKEQYILLVGSAYVQDGDLDEAQSRLDQLQAPNIRQWIAQLADQYIAEGRSETDIRAMVGLAHALNVDTPQMLAYLASPTPLPTDTPLPTPTPEPTDTPNPTSIPPTATSIPPSDTPSATDTPLPQPTDTAAPAVNTAQPAAALNPTNTPKPPSPTKKPAAPTNTPKPPSPTKTPKPAAAKWTITEQRLVGPGEDAQRCDAGNLQIRATVIDAAGNQIPGVWIHEFNTGTDLPTGHKGGDPYWGPGEAEFTFYGQGGGRLCITSGQGGACESPQTREMPCWNMPPVQDLFAAGYCNACCEIGATIERCQQLINEGKCMGAGHYSWRVVFKRSW
jgi:hypothetical protein